MLGGEAGAASEYIASPEGEQRGHYQVFNVETLYGTPEGVMHNASILVGPDGTIVDVKPRSDMERELNARAEDTTFEVVRSNTEVILPALTDAHNHPILFGELGAIAPAEVYGARDFDDLSDRLRSQFADKSGLQLAVGLDTSLFPQLSREDLDGIRKEPFVLSDASFHGAVGNSAAMQEIELWVFENDLEGTLSGYYDERGNLTEEYAMIGMEMMERALDPGLLIEGAEQYLREMHRGGAAYTHDMEMSTLKQLEIVQGLSERARQAIRQLHVTPRLLHMIQAHDFDLASLGIPVDLKLFADGSNNSHTALYYDPYVDSGTYGLEFHSDLQAEEAMKLASEMGMQGMATHAIGDRGIDRAVEFAKRWHEICRGLGRDSKARIEHMTMPRDDSIIRARDMGAYVSPQPNFMPDIVPYKGRFSPRQIEGMVPMRRMYEMGLVKQMIGTDGMPNNMLMALHCALDAPYAGQRLDLKQVIELATTTAPQYEGSNRGKIQVGMPADFLLTTKRAIDKLTGSYNLYSVAADEQADLMYREVPADLNAEVVDVTRAGHSILQSKEPD